MVRKLLLAEVPPLMEVGTYIYGSVLLRLSLRSQLFLRLQAWGSFGAKAHTENSTFPVKCHRLPYVKMNVLQYLMTLTISLLEWILTWDVLFKKMSTLLLFLKKKWYKLLQGRNSFSQVKEVERREHASSGLALLWNYRQDEVLKKGKSI